METTYKFKTNINCGACVAKVKPELDGASNISEWNVDTDTYDKILTVKAADTTAEHIKDLIKAKGFKIEDI
jgi:copper chaperone